jgi:hypothetical protein
MPLVGVTVQFGECTNWTVLAVLVALLTAQVLGVVFGWSGVLSPAQVRVGEAIAEGEAAVSKPGILLAKWRHVVTVPRDVPAVREVVVVTPYYRIAREAYLRAVKGKRLTPAEARVLLDRLVREHGPSTLGILPRFSPPPSVLPHLHSISLFDASRRKLPVTGFFRPQGRSYEEVELVVDARKADLRRLTITVPVDPPQHIEVDLRGMR